MATSKKDFAGINAGRVYGAIEQATKEKGKQTEPSPQEKAERADEMRTQGRKGCKAIRFTMAFTPDNHQFISVMAKASGKTMTEFTNMVIAAYRKEHPEIMEQAEAFLNTVNSGIFSSLLDGENNAEQE